MYSVCTPLMSSATPHFIYTVGWAGGCGGGWEGRGVFGVVLRNPKQEKATSTKLPFGSGFVLHTNGQIIQMRNKY